MLHAVWKESVNIFNYLPFLPSRSTITALCGVWLEPVSPPAQYQKLLVNLLQRPIEVLTVLEAYQSHCYPCPLLLGTSCSV